MLDVVKKAILDLREGIETPQFQARIDNPRDYPVLTSPEGKMMTHKMADSGNIAYPMIQLQEDGTLKDYGDNFVGAKQDALATGNYKKFDTESEAQEYARGGYKTEEFKQFGKNPPFAVQGYQQAVPEYYFEPGLQQVSPAAEFFGLGIGKIAANAIGKTKMYSDQVVDRFTRMTTPKTTYHGGESNVGTLKTTYDRSIEGEKVTNTIPQKLGMSDKVMEIASDYSPFQAALYTGPKKLADQYAMNGSSLYNLDISSATKIYNSNKPSTFMKEALRKEIKIAKEAGDIRKTNQLDELLDVGKYMSRVTPVQREFLEKYGYEGIKTKETYRYRPMGRTKRKQKDESATLLFRPEKYPAKESNKLSEMQGKAFRKDLAKKTGAAIGATALVGGILGSQYGKGFN